MQPIRNLLHADRVWRLMAAGLSLDDASGMDDASAELMLEAWDIACQGGPPDEITIVWRTE